MSSTKIITLLPHLFVAVILITTIVIVTEVILSILQAIMHHKYDTLKTVIATLLCIAVLYWIFSMGWLRMVLTFMMIPFIHAAVFFFVNLFVADYVNKSKEMKIINVLFYVSYLLFYLLLPDGGKNGQMYVFFGLIHSNIISNICYALSNLIVLSHIALLILQIVKVINMRKSTVNEE